MSVRDDQQLVKVCRVLCASVRRAEWWPDSGPTLEAVELMERNGGPLSSGERAMLLAAFALWNGAGGLTLAQAINVLDNPRLRLLGTLFVALADTRGDVAIDDWLHANLALLKATPTKGGAR